MLLDEFESILLGEEHEPVHRPLRLVRVVLLLLLGRRRRRRHLRSDRDEPRDGSGQRRDRIVGRELEASKPVAKIRRSNGFRMVRGKADVSNAQLLTRDAVLLQGQPGLTGAPAWKKVRLG